jgi:hypothetical protein
MRLCARPMPSFANQRLEDEAATLKRVTQFLKLFHPLYIKFAD